MRSAGGTNLKFESSNEEKENGALLVCLLRFSSRWEALDSICVVEIWEDNKVFDVFIVIVL